MRIAAALVLLAITADASAAASACDTPEHHQFDFWVGEWTVATPDGKHAGDNRIERIVDGCALRESWTGAKGGVGTSYNAYDSARKVWHQTWVDRSGTLLLLEGGVVDGRMVLSGKSGTTLNRISWEPRKDGSVRQLWETSTDLGKSWQTAFDGLYRHPQN